MYNINQLRKVGKACQAVLDVITMTDRDQDRLHWYTTKLSELRRQFYALVDSDQFDAADAMNKRVLRLTQRRDQVIARQAASYDNLKF